MPPPIGISAALPPVSVARPSPPETEMKTAVAKPQARETQAAAAPPAKVAPVEADERSAPAKREAEARISANARLTIDYDKDAGRYVYRLVDPATREVLREVPSEDALRRIRAIRQAAGFTVDKRT